MRSHRFFIGHGSAQSSRRYGLEHVTLRTEELERVSPSGQEEENGYKDRSTLLALELRLGGCGECTSVSPLPVFSPESGIWS